MITDKQVRRLMKLMQEEMTLAIAASKAGMDEKTARKYLNNGKLPSQCRPEHDWRTRQNPFEEEWREITDKLEINPGLEAKTIFEYLQRKEPGKFQDGQLRTLQRHIKVWRATEGPAKEIYFPQRHFPGQLSASDFTDMSGLEITIAKEPFDHLIYHFILTYSNWETGSICFSESYGSLSEGLQNALWELGGVPARHRTDRLSAAVHKECNPEEFTKSYQGLLGFYALRGEKIQAGKANENGDIEQRHYRFKKAVDQALLLRCDRDFASRRDYETFLNIVFKQLNSGRTKRFQEELKKLGRLPGKRLDDCKKEKVRVGPSSTVRVDHNTYSVHSRLKGEWVEARIYAQHIDIWYGQKKIERLPRLKGERKFKIDYRHVIDWLVRKPGAFANYRYRSDLFPSSSFRMAYDALKDNHTQQVASSQYLKILHLAAMDSEIRVEGALRDLLCNGETIDIVSVKVKISLNQNPSLVREVVIQNVDLAAYDNLLENSRQEVACG